MKKAYELKEKISKAIEEVDENLSYSDLAAAVASVIREDYGDHNIKPFIDALKKELNMKHVKTFESFLNEANLSYWKDYTKGHEQSPSWMNDEVKNFSKVAELVDSVIKYEQAVSDIPFEVEENDEKALLKLASDYFKQFKTINGNVVSAMLFQETK